MRSAESREGRRIVCTVDRGAEVLDALRDACRRHGVRSGALAGTGAVERVELAAYDQSRKRWHPARVLDGGLQLVSLTGTISEQAGEVHVSAHATLMRDRDSGLELVGGSVQSATSFAVEVVIDAFDDLLLRRAADGATGLLLWREMIGAEPEQLAAAPEPEPAAPAKPTWADVIAASQPEPPALAPAPPPAAAQPEILIQSGDMIVHPRFGSCLVMRVEGNQEFVHIQLRNGRIARLSLDVVSLSARGVENGHRVFDASIV